MKSNFRFKLFSAAAGAIVCGFVGAVIGAIAATGTSVLLPGLGLIIAGPIVAGFVVGFLGVIFGAIFGFFVASIIIRIRDKTYP